MDQIITFDKSLQQRLQEFRDIFSGYELLPASGVSNVWTFYLELTVDPNGWQAVWKIPRLTCEHLNIPFPSVVLVLVLDVNYSEHLATVRILAVQDDISIPEKHFVQLTQLWPTKEQDKTIALNLHTTSGSLRYVTFLLHTHDENSDWKNKHLESRLRLYFDLKNGIIPRATAEHVHSLLTEARRLQSRKVFIEAELNEDDDADFDNGNTNNKKVEALMEIHLRLLEIKREIEIMENPLLRNVVIKKQAELISARSNKKQQIWLIFDEGNVDDHITFLREVKNSYPSQPIIFFPSLASKLESSNSKDIFILNESQHVIRTTGALEKGGVLKGIGLRKNIILTSRIDDVMLDFTGETVLIENVTIDARHAQCAILVRSGVGVLKNCKIIGNGASSTHQGIIVLAGATVEIVDCEITGFCTSIVGNSGSTISLKNTEIHNVNFGIKIYEKCHLDVNKLSIHDSREYGIVVETENNSNVDNRKVGNFEILQIVPEVKTESISGINNTKGDVIINSKCKIKPVEDLFSDPDFDPTMIESSDEDIMYFMAVFMLYA
ncbi:hypothetical protein NQ318_015252 [Aromia moschata]|uniref:Right handed beta helix domain-containing protein n=1 Tax=Aromia moschata TaxID=1265417 RepID=A0AAV8YHE5_9CUCU|nr:hypothetical protein NQ318_015252 [Aromia moschata]